MITGDDIVAALEHATDLERVQTALNRETLIRAVMADSGEDRRTVADMVDAMRSMGEEAVLDLMDGEPTTLEAGLQRYVDELAGRDELQPRDRILDDLSTLLAYPWPGAEPDLREAVLDLVKGEPTTLRAAVQEYAARLDRYVKAGDSWMPITIDEVADDLASILTYPWPGGPELDLTDDGHVMTISVGGSALLTVDREDNTLSSVSNAVEAVHKAVTSLNN